MNKMIEDMVEQCANAYKVCAQYMNRESLDLIERNHRQKIIQDCVHRQADFMPYIKRYEELTGTGVK